MKEYTIYENGSAFASIVARTAKAALRKACLSYPRTKVDYNIFSDEKEFTVEWQACSPGAARVAIASVPVPSRGLDGVRIEVFDRCVIE